MSQPDLTLWQSDEVVKSCREARHYFWTETERWPQFLGFVETCKIYLYHEKLEFTWNDSEYICLITKSSKQSISTCGISIIEVHEWDGRAFVKEAVHYKAKINIAPISICSEKQESYAGQPFLKSKLQQGIWGYVFFKIKIHTGKKAQLLNILLICKGQLVTYDYLGQHVI